MPQGALSNRVWTDAGVYTWLDLLNRAASRWGGALDSGAWACIVDDPLEALECAVLGMVRGLDLAILGRERLSEPVESALVAAGLRVVGESLGDEGNPVGGRVWILTSGSTGTPKLIQHTWETLLTLRESPEPRRWLLPFQAGTYAWFQLVLPSLCLDGQELVVPPAGADVAEILATGLKCHANAISSTPTFWRVALMVLGADELKRLSFKQISLGGEIVDQAILDQLRALYPEARITHIFAATEVGACIVVHDGLEGFPAAWLEDARREVGLAERDGILWVHSSKRGRSEGLAEPDGWICTGDLIERSGDRVRFKGRSGRQLINVGGQKAYPSDVESALLSHPEVRWCRVSARRAPLMGSLVSADVVLTPGIDGASLEEELVAHCRSRLAEYAVPRFFQFLMDIPCSGNLKSSL